MTKYNIKNWERFLNENSQKLIDFDSFPVDVRKTLEDEYTQLGFDWNEKQEEFDNDPEGFDNWMIKHKSDQFLKNLDDIIRKTTQDMILIKRQEISKKKLDAFEELIIPSLGNEIVQPTLSKFEEEILMNPYLTIHELEKGMRDAKSIFDKEGNIDPLKIEKSEIFPGGEINVPAFEKFIKNHPEFQGAYDHWKKLFDEDMELTLQDLNAFRDSTPIEKIRELRKFLIEFKKKL